MIAKTFTAVFGSLIVSISLLLNLSFLPIQSDVSLLVGLFLSFPLWLAAMVIGYGCSKASEAWRKYAVILCFSVIINVIFMVYK